MAWNLGPRISATERSQADIRTEVSSLRQDTLDIKSIMTDIYQTFKGDTEDMETQDTDEDKVEKEQVSEEPKHDVPISTVKPIETLTPEVQPITTIISTSQPESSQVPQREGKGIATDEQLESITKKLVPTSKVISEEPDEPIKIKKATEEAKRIKMTKTKVIKFVPEEAENIGIDPKKIISAKAGEKFKKAHDVEILKPDPIPNVKIHSNSKPAALTVYRNNDKRNFHVHNPFKFTDFGVTELDELGPIIQKKKNTIVESK
ncbi:hypothetical protein Tco_1358701 [Tanacetum coccineum]